MKTPQRLQTLMTSCLNITRQTHGWQKLIRQVFLDDIHQADVIIRRIEAGSQIAAFRAQAALIAWTRRRSETASSLCIKTLLEDMHSCQFEEWTGDIVGEFATFMMAETGKAGGQWR